MVLPTHVGVILPWQDLHLLNTSTTHTRGGDPELIDEES